MPTSKLQVLAVALLLGPASHAQGPDLARIPASARWVAHLDLASFRQSTVGAALLDGERAGNSPWAEGLRQLRDLEPRLGFDPLRSAHTLTLYGGRSPGRSAVAVLTGTAALDGLLEHARATASPSTFELEGLPVHHWAFEDDLGERQEVYLNVESGDPRAPRTMTLARHVTDLAGALRARAGRDATLATSADSALTTSPPAGTFLSVTSAVGLDALPGAAPRFELTDLARSFSLELGEASETFFARARIGTPSTRDAQNAVGLLMGLRSLASLTAGEGSGAHALVVLLERLSIESNAEDVRIRIELPARDVIERLESREP